VGVKDAHVWHCSLSLRADEPELSDEQWAHIAEEFVAGMGFADALHLAGSSGAERFATFDEKLVKSAKKLDVTKVILA